VPAPASSRGPARYPLADPGIQRVVLVRLRVGLGDLLCSAPALRALAEVRPDLQVSVVTYPEMAPVVARLGFVHELLPFPGADGIPERPPHPEGWAPFVAAAHERRFDLALQCYGDNPAANRVAAALGAPLVGGFAPTGWTPPDGAEDLHLRYPTTEHEVRRHLLLLEHLGLELPPDAGRMDFPTTELEREQHAASLRRLGLEPGQYVVLHPGASAAARRWPATSYAAVAARLAEAGRPVVVTGTAGERDLAASVVAMAGAQQRGGPAVIDRCGRTDLAGAALLIGDAAVLVGNDTGTAHLAAAVGAPSVTVFQSGDPRRWAHPQREALALLPGVACSPCHHLRCPIDFRCSRATTPSDVLAAVGEATAACA
jgi:ADP-heptose:LPS heptosyltransferase